MEYIVISEEFEQSVVTTKAKVEKQISLENVHTVTVTMWAVSCRNDTICKSKQGIQERDLSPNCKV